MHIGGSITLTIQVTVLYTPLNSKESSQLGVLILIKKFSNIGLKKLKSCDKSSEG